MLPLPTHPPYQRRGLLWAGLWLELWLGIVATSIGCTTDGLKRQSEECLRNSDCQATQACYSNICTTLCQTTLDCSLQTGETCNGGICIITEGQDTVVPDPPATEPPATEPPATEPPATSTAISLSLGDYHSCAVSSAGAAKCWGSDMFGALGDGGNNQNRAHAATVISLNTSVISIAAGGSHSCALIEIPSALGTGSGIVKCWGKDNSAQLGDGGSHTRQVTPVDVIGLPLKATQVSNGGGFSCAVLTDATVWCWGYNFHGELGANSALTSANMPLQVSGLLGAVQSIAVGDQHSCALLTDGKVQCWGYGYYGQLGDGSNNTKQSIASAAVLLPALATQLSTGFRHSCAVLQVTSLTDPSLYCWGYNSNGQLGNGDTNNSLVAVAVQGLSATATMVAAGGQHTCAILSNDTVQCFGYDGFTQLGDGGANQTQYTPVTVWSTLTGINSISAGKNHNCISYHSGGIQCWGANGLGQSGGGILGGNQVIAPISGW